MAEFGFDCRELMDYAKSVQKAREKNEKKEVRSFMRREGNKLKRRTIAQAKASGIDLNHKKPKEYANAKHYLQTIQRGKVYEYNGATAIRVYSYAPHAHLLEDGHVVWLPTGKGYAQNMGYMSRKFMIFKTARNGFDHLFMVDAEKFEDGILRFLMG